MPVCSRQQIVDTISVWIAFRRRVGKRTKEKGSKDQRERQLLQLHAAAKAGAGNNNGIWHSYSGIKSCRASGPPATPAAGTWSVHKRRPSPGLFVSAPILVLARPFVTFFFVSLWSLSWRTMRMHTSWASASRLLLLAHDTRQRRWQHANTGFIWGLASMDLHAAKSSMHHKLSSLFSYYLAVAKNSCDVTFSCLFVGRTQSLHEVLVLKD